MQACIGVGMCVGVCMWVCMDGGRDRALQEVDLPFLPYSGALSLPPYPFPGIKIHEKYRIFMPLYTQDMAPSRLLRLLELYLPDHESFNLENLLIILW